MLDEKLAEYAKRFGEGFPMIPLGWGRTDDEIASLIDKCMETGKDVYAMGLVQEDDVMY